MIIQISCLAGFLILLAITNEIAIGQSEIGNNLWRIRNTLAHDLLLSLDHLESNF